ncbi:MAG: molybdopterin molybdotransferase MoeA [Pseudoflavonifractor sp.]|nr:molybdopterin molybdotransferase MoeA [Pseudoflavonifractor sp.]
MSTTERISLEAGLVRLMTLISPLSRREQVPLSAAPGRVLAQPVITRLDAPPFSRSPLDGYALRAADTAGATPERPIRLALGGQAVPVSTGSPIPAGLDCVVKVEDTQREGDTVILTAPLSPWQNYIFQGEDMRAGVPLFSAGTRLDWTCIGALAVQGIETLPVFARPRVGVLSTGGELSPMGKPLPTGSIHDANGPLLAARLNALGMEPILFPPTEDNAAAIARQINAAFTKAACDFLLTTGGVSVGTEDALPHAAELLGATVLFHGLAVRPGSPAMAFSVERHPVLALSGNPFAALAVFEAVGRPALDALAGCSCSDSRRVSLRLGGGLPASSVRRLIRAFSAGETVTPAAGGHSSGQIYSLSGCNCLIDRLPGPTLPPGAPVSVLSL